MAEPETVGVGPANEPAVASPEPTAAPATGCELLIYSETNFKGMSTPADEDQPGLSENGWQNEIASVQIKSGTWDFYSDEDLCRRNDAAERRFLSHARPEVEQAHRLVHVFCPRQVTNAR